MNIELIECEFNARDSHIIGMIRDLETARVESMKE